jgi:hypothetical protein
MLDFYLLKDDQSKPEYPEKAGLEFVGELDFKVFDQLQRKGVIDTRFDYYSDFRWETEFIKQIRMNIVQKYEKADVDELQLLHLVEVAYLQKSGLIAYGD